MAPYEQLKQWIADQAITNAEAARRVEYDRSNFHRIIEGRAKPTMELAHRIEIATEGAVPMGAWVGFEPLADQQHRTSKQVADSTDGATSSRTSSPRRSTASEGASAEVRAA